MATINELLITMAKNLEDDDTPSFRRNLEEFNRLRQNMFSLMTDVELMQLMCEQRAELSRACNDEYALYHDKENIRAELKVLREELRDRIW